MPSAARLRGLGVPAEQLQDVGEVDVGAQRDRRALGAGELGLVGERGQPAAGRGRAARLARRRRDDRRVQARGAARRAARPGRPPPSPGRTGPSRARPTRRPPRPSRRPRGPPRSRRFAVSAQLVMSSARICEPAMVASTTACARVTWSGGSRASARCSVAVGCGGLARVPLHDRVPLKQQRVPHAGRRPGWRPRKARRARRRAATAPGRAPRTGRRRRRRAG